MDNFNDYATQAWGPAPDGHLYAGCEAEGCTVEPTVLKVMTMITIKDLIAAITAGPGSLTKWTEQTLQAAYRQGYHSALEDIRKKEAAELEAKLGTD